MTEAKEKTGKPVEMDSYKMDIFRRMSKIEEDAFEMAIKAKDTAINFYAKSYENSRAKEEKENADHEPDIFLLKFITAINQIYDPHYSPEPEALRLLIRKIRSQSWLFIDEGSPPIVQFGKKQSIIPQWANRLYVENPLEMEQFIKLCKWVYSLEYTVNLFDEAFINDLKKEHVQDKPLILYFNHPLSSARTIHSNSLNISNLENRFLNAIEKLKDITTNNARKLDFIILGCYRDFTSKSDLLRDLDTLKIFPKTSYNEMFSNDYLFLNNAEFISEDISTESIKNHLIIPPQLVNETDKTKIIPNEHLYFYAKNTDDTAFFRHEMFGTNIDLNRFWEVAEFAQQVVPFPKPKSSEGKIRVGKSTRKGSIRNRPKG